MEDKWRELQNKGYFVEEHDDFFIQVDPNDNWVRMEEKHRGISSGTTGGRAAIPLMLRWRRESEGRGKFMDLQFNQCSESGKKPSKWQIARQAFMKGWREAASDSWMLPYMFLGCTIGTYLSFRINGVPDHLRWIDVLFTVPFAGVSFWLIERKRRP